MRTLLASAFALLFAAVPLASASPLPAAQHSCVRALSPNMAELLQDAIQRSATVRRQVDTLDASNLVVYLAETFESAPRAPKAKLQFMTSAGGTRYLRLCLARWRLSRSQRVVMLAHELQHAVEIAAAPEVRDAASFCALFRRIGWERAPGRFETDGARQVTEKLWAEIYGVDSGHRGGSAGQADLVDEDAPGSRKNRRMP